MLVQLTVRFEVEKNSCISL